MVTYLYTLLYLCYDTSLMFLQLELVDVDTEEQHKLLINHWFSTSDEDGQTCREFSISRPGEMPLPGNHSNSVLKVIRL